MYHVAAVIFYLGAEESDIRLGRLAESLSQNSMLSPKGQEQSSGFAIGIGLLMLGYQPNNFRSKLLPSGKTGHGCGPWTPKNLALGGTVPRSRPSQGWGGTPQRRMAAHNRNLALSSIGTTKYTDEIYFYFYLTQPQITPSNPVRDPPALLLVRVLSFPFSST
jgi:hypothetical protein